MSQAFADLDVLASPLPSPLQPQSLSQTTTPTPTPTQGDYNRARLPQGAVSTSHAATRQPKSETDVENRWEQTQQREKEREANEDKFAVLFEPSTPRASPVPASTQLPPSSDMTCVLDPSITTSTFPLFDQPKRIAPQTRPPPRPHNGAQRSRPSSIASTASSDFGSFVEVSTAEDPLSASFAAQTIFPIESTLDYGGNTQGSSTPLRPGSQIPTRPPSSNSAPFSSTSNLPDDWNSHNSSAQSKPPSSSTAGLAFFDTFTQDAKQRSSAARSKVLDELLLHQDDPMWFVNDEQQDPNTTSISNEVADDVHNKNLPMTPALNSPPPPPPPPKDTSAHQHLADLSSPPPPPVVAQSLLDLDHDYFKPISSSSANQLPPHHGHPRHSSSPSHFSPPSAINRKPSRSGSIPVLAPPTLAPPVASQLTASPPSVGGAKNTLSISDNYWEFDPLGGGGTGVDIVEENPSLASAVRSSSYQTISSLPSKWMTSILGSGPPAATSGGALPALESIFSSPNVSGHEATLPSSGQRRNASVPFGSTSAGALHVPAHSQTLPISPSALTSTSPQPVHPTTQQPTFTHTTPFAPAFISHGTSPFAPAIYVPPSGAPGFKGEAYTWDKGFSDELEDERKGQTIPRNTASKSRGRYGDEGRTRDRKVASTSGGGVGSWVSGSRGGWGSGFGLGFGSARGSKGKAKTPSPSNSVLSLGPGVIHDGRSSRSPSLYSHENGDSGRSGVDSRARNHTGHDRENVSTPPPAMGEFMDLKSTVELVGRKLSSTPVLTTELASMLRGHLPALSRLPRSWSLIYSLDQHGISLNTLYSHCEAHLSRKPAPGEVLGVGKGMLIVIKDAGGEDSEDGSVFGAWIAEGVVLNKGKGYSGGGESFLWKYANGKLDVFKATGRNNYVALCEPEYISFGGGDGHYGLYLDDTLFDGSSAPCPTFDNEPLCSVADGSTTPRNLKAVKFECVGLEVWGMGS